MVRPVKWEICPSVLIGAAFAVLLVPLRWLFAMVLAAAFHESCHLGMLRLMKKTVYSICVRCSGTYIGTQPMEPGEELLCAVAGPFGSFLMLFFRSLFPELALCGMIQGLWNLLPLYPLDGGRVLRSALFMLWPDRTDKIMNLVRWSLYGLLAAVWLGIFRYSIVFWIFAVLIGGRAVVRKNSCNKLFLAVQ